MITWILYSMRQAWPYRGDPPLRKIVKCIVTGLLTIVIVSSIFKMEIWNLYLFSAFKDPQFDERLMFGVTLLIAISATSFSVGYVMIDLFAWTWVKAMWIWRSARRLFKDGRTRMSIKS